MRCGARLSGVKPRSIAPSYARGEVLSDIKGVRVEVRDTAGRLLPKRTLGPVVEGHDFAVV